MTAAKIQTPERRQAKQPLMKAKKRLPMGMIGKKP